MRRLMCLFRLEFVNRSDMLADIAGRPVYLAMAMDDIAGQAGKINSRMLGRWIERMQGRIVDGKRFVRIGHRAGLLHWAVHQSAALRPMPSADAMGMPAADDVATF